MTSLSRQLSRLRVPQTSAQKEKKGSVSFLYEFLEAKSIDADTHYAIAETGLQSLIELDISIDRFSKTLFNESSKTLDRALQSREANEELDREIELYLFSVVSKYFLLSSTHKTIEWLIYRYAIHQYNTDALLAATFPYHETRFFARLLQTCGKIRVETSEWFWLTPVQKNGSTLPKLTLITHCTHDARFLHFICDNLVKCLKIDPKNNSYLVFFVSTIINIIERKTNETILSIVIPTVVKGLKSKIEGFRKASYCLCAHICSRIRLEPKVVNKFLRAMAKRYSSSMSDEFILTLESVLRFQQVENLPSNLVSVLPDTVLVDSYQRYETKNLINHILRHLILDCTQISSNEKLIALLEKLTLTSLLVDTVVQSISKVALIENARIPSDTFSKVLSLLEIRYPLFFDASLSKLDSLSSIAPFLNNFRYLLLDNSKVPLIYGITDSNELIRSEAIDYMVKNFEELIKQTDKSANNDIKTLLSNALNFKSPQTLITIFGLKEKMFIVFSDEEMREICLNLLTECQLKESITNHEESNSWHQLKNSILATYCSKATADSQSQLSVIYPYLLPLDDKDLISLSIIINSNFAKQNQVLNIFRKKFKRIFENDESRSNIDSIVILIATEIASFYTDNLNLVIDEAFIPNHQNIDHIKSCILSLIILERLNNKSDPSVKHKSAYILANLIELMIKSHKISKPKNSLPSFEDLVHNCVKNLKKNRINMSNIIFVISSVISTIDWPNETNTESEWFWFKQSASSTNYLYKLFSLIFNNCYDNNKNKSEAFRDLLITYVGKLTTHLGYDFFGPLWSDNRSLLWQSRSLAVTSRLAKSPMPYNSVTAISAVIALRSPLSFSRESTLKVIHYLKDSKMGFDKLFKKFMTNAEAIINDESVVSVLIADYLSSKANTEALKNLFIDALNDDNPSEYFKADVILLLNKCHQLLKDILPKIESYFSTSPIDKQKMKTIENVISFYSEPNVFQNCLSKDDPVFKFFTKSLRTNSTQQKTINIIFKSHFESIQSKELKTILLNELLDIISERSDRSVHRILKKLLSTGDLILSVLTSLVPIDDSVDCEPESKKMLLSESQFNMESINWKKFILTLEIVANKKHLSNVSNLVKVLFEYLKKTFIIETKSSLEYLRQLLLNCLINSIKQNEDLPFGQIESVIECLRECQHKETQKTALILISSVANKYKEEILGYVIPIFTFIGTNLLHCDDQYSIQIVYETMEAIIPILLADDNKYKDDVINVFIGSLPDIPAHRRLNLLNKLLEMLGQSKHLAFILMKVVEQIFGKSKSEREPYLNLMSALCSKCNIDVQIESINKLMDIFISEFTDDRRHLSITDQGFSENDRRLIAQSLAQMILSIVSSQDFIQTTQQTEWNQISHQLEGLLHRLIILINKFNVTQNESSLKDSNMNRRRIRNLLNQILLQFNSLLPNEQLVALILQLLSNESLSIKRKALEMLNEKLERYRSEPFDFQPKLTKDLLNCLISMFPTPTSINHLDEGLIYNTQLLMLSTKFLTKHTTGNEDLQSIVYNLLQQMIVIINAMEADISANLKASCVLCLTQLMISLSNKSIPLIPSILPIIIDNFNLSDEILIVSNIAAVSKISQNFAKFLSPYLKQIIIKLLSTSNKYSNIKPKLKSIWNIFAKFVPKQVLVSSIDSAFDDIANISFDSVIELMTLLKSIFENLSAKNEVNAIQNSVKNIMIKALDLRNHYHKDVDSRQMMEVEDASNEAFSVYIPKMTEVTFRPLFFKLYNWAIREKSGQLYHRIISFYRLVNLLAHKLKSLFCIFVGPSIVNNCAQLLSTFHSDNSSQVDLDTENSNQLVISILWTLSNCFLYDTNGSFLNKDRMQALAKPMINQLNNTSGTEEHCKQRVESLCLCIKNLVESNRDEVVIKHFNYEILLQTRHASSQVRLAALQVVHRLILSAGEDYLPIIPETIPFISELNEDDSDEIEDLVKKVVVDLEQIIGEPISNYL